MTTIRKIIIPRKEDAASPKGAPTWGNDGQDEARAQAFIEGKNFAVAHAQRLAENCKIMLSRVEAILQCDEALQGCVADDAFGETYEDLLRADKKELREALAQWEKDNG